mmetsp:Transcript_2659/g.6241  ORF Transcript_2659/g.6241 Transcript_2659/m.6241 type:complete len:444 (-) Transcript_2659:676-2007(-)
MQVLIVGQRTTSSTTLIWNFHAVTGMAANPVHQEKSRESSSAVRSDTYPHHNRTLSSASQQDWYVVLSRHSRTKASGSKRCPHKRSRTCCHERTCRTRCGTTRWNSSMMRLKCGWRFWLSAFRATASAKARKFTAVRSSPASTPGPCTWLNTRPRCGEFEGTCPVRGPTCGESCAWRSEATCESSKASSSTPRICFSKSSILPSSPLCARTRRHATRNARRARLKAMPRSPSSAARSRPLPHSSGCEGAPGNPLANPRLCTAATASKSSLVLVTARSRCAGVFASWRRRAEISTASSHLCGTQAEHPTCTARDWKTCSALLGITASKPRSASSTVSASSRTRVGSSWTNSGVRCTNSARNERYQPAPSSLRPGTNCKSSKLGSCPSSCLQRDGAKSKPKGHSCATAMPKSRPKKRLQRMGCCGTLSKSAARGVKNPGMGLSWK